MTSRRVIEMKDNVPNGNWSFQYTDGQGMYQFMVVDGIRTGPFIAWYPSGQVAMRGTYFKRHPVGHWTRWYDNGEKWTEGEYTDGALSGTWTTWDRDGKKISEEKFVPEKSRCADGRRKIGAEPPKGIAMRCESVGKDGVPVGTETYWYPNGQKWSEAGYRGEFPTGDSVEWYSNGQMAQKSTFEKGLREGVATSWYPEGMARLPAE